jgi:subtilisin-like proprotein convertase family protein
MRHGWLARLLCLLLVVTPVSLFAPPGPPPIARAATFQNLTQIVTPDLGPASPYPSNIVVAGVTGVVSKVTVTLFDINHSFADDFDILLVGPGGQSVLLMSDVAADRAANGVSLTFDDAAAAPLPQSAPLMSGIFRPTDIDPPSFVDEFAPPAPAPPYGTALSVFNGTDPNGTWSLFVVDDGGFNRGILNSGWEISINNAPPVAGLPGPNPVYTENASPVILFPGAIITDPDSANFRNGGLFIAIGTGGHPADRLGVRHQGAGPGQIGVAGSEVRYEGKLIATITGGTGPTVPLNVKFTTFDATASAAQAALRNVTFQNLSDQLAPTTRFLQVGVGDGDGGISAPATR